MAGQAPDQLTMEVGAGIMPAPTPVAGPFQAPCGDLGPYVWERYTAGGRKTYVAIKCNRPRHRDGPHQWADPEAGVAFVWAVDGRPVHPLPIGARCSSCGKPEM